jgi:hypothetical protein
MKSVSILTCIFLLAACTPSDTTTCTEPNLNRIYTEKGCNGDICGYYHTIMLDSYSENCFNDYDFIYLADMYLDSVRIDIPVKGITFVKPFNFQPVYDSRDVGPIRDNSIVDIFYSDSIMNDKVPEISSISIWTNKKRKNLDYLHTSFRQQRMKFYMDKRK